MLFILPYTYLQQTLGDNVQDKVCTMRSILLSHAVSHSLKLLFHCAAPRNFNFESASGLATPMCLVWQEAGPCAVEMYAANNCVLCIK